MKTIKPKKIPTLVGLFLVATLVVLVSMGFNAVTRSQTRATPATEPQHITYTNVTDSAFTATWSTSETSKGAIIVSGDGIVPKTYYDDRDLGGTQGSYKAHSVTATGLVPATAYIVSILSDGQTYAGLNEPYRITTAPVIQPVISGFEPAYGTASAQTGQPLTDAIVYLTLTGGQTLSTLVKDNGSYIIPINLVRTRDLTVHIPFAERIDAEIRIRSGTETADAVTDTLNDSPVPVIVLGKSYDFRKLQANTSGKPLATFPINGIQKGSGQDTEVLGTEDSRKNSLRNLTITQPKDKSTLVSNLPLFTGTGNPGTLIQVSLGIKDTLTFSVKVGSDGVWRFTPKKPLDSGKQSITVTGQSKNAKTAVTHVFDILKSGTQVLGEATGSGTIEPTPTPTARIQPTIQPTVQPTPTTITTATPSPTPADTGYEPPEPPVTGAMTNTILLIAVSLGFILGGFLLSLL